jgi:hypothetical protein
MSKENRLLICGKNFHARAAFRKLRSLPDAGKILGFIDTEAEQQGPDFMHLPVFPLAKIEHFDYDQIIIAGRYVDRMRQKLSEFVSPSKIREMKRSEFQPTLEQLTVRSKQTKSMLVTLLDVLEKNRIDYWLLASSLLAIERRQDLAWFADVDIAVPNAQIQTLDSILRSSSQLPSAQTNIQSQDGPFWKGGSPYQIVLRSDVDLVEFEPAVLDIHALFIYDDRAYYSTGNAAFLSVSPHHFDGAETVHYEGMALRVPLDRHDYLSSTYGESWHTPSESFLASDHQGRWRWPNA